MPKTYNDLYLATRTALKNAGVEAYALEARLRELADGLQNGGRDKITVVGIGQTAEHLEDDRCAGFLRGFQNTHDALLRVAVERWDCAAFFFSQRKNGS